MDHLDFVVKVRIGGQWITAAEFHWRKHAEAYFDIQDGPCELWTKWDQSKPLAAK